MLILLWLLPPKQNTIVKARKKDKVESGVLNLESCMLPLEDSTILAHQRRNPICLCKFRVTLQSMNFTRGRQEWEKISWWLRMQLEILGAGREEHWGVVVEDH